MRRVGVQPEAALGQLSRTTTITSAADGVRTALSHIWAQIRIQPTTVFVVLSLVFGLSVIFVMPPLRGPDEIAHFLRIYSYTRGELLPAAEIDGQKGIFVESHLHNELHFFKGAGNGSPQPETRAFATDKSWRCTETSSPQLTTNLTKPLCSCRSPAPKATIRWHTFHTSSQGQSDERSGSSFQTCCC